jgi:hypothetical protein
MKRWTIHLYYIKKIKTVGKVPRFLNGLVQGILFYIEKLFSSLGGDAL